MLSQRALQLLAQMFNEQSNVTFPAGVARQVVEIEDWVKDQLGAFPADNPNVISTAKRGRPASKPPDVH